MTKKKERLRNIHPGEILEEEFLKILGISHYRLAKDLHVTQTRISELCRGKRAVTADTALRLARYFDTTPHFWLGLQENYDLREASRTKASMVLKIKPFAKAS